MVARVQFPCLPSYRKTSPSPPTGDHEGNKCRSQPHIHHPRPYRSPGLLPDFPAEVDGYWMTFKVIPLGRSAALDTCGRSGCVLHSSYWGPRSYWNTCQFSASRV
jgi:hypothetical protein